MTTSRRIFTTSTLAALIALAAAPAALAQATRTWVSGTGDDANPCSRTAPCKTFAGAISKTAAGGEINAIDPGGFGAVTITKAITIDATGTQAGVLVSGTNGIVIQAGVNDVVVLRNLNIDGLGTGIDGVKVITAKRVSVENSRIYNFAGSAINFPVTNPGATLNVINSELSNNSGDGVLVAPPSGGTATATLTGDDVVGNRCGVVAGSYGVTGNYNSGCGTAASSAGGTGRGSIATFHSQINANTTIGVLSEGTRASNEISDDEVTGSTRGLEGSQGGTILSWSNNFVYGNAVDGAPTGTITPMIRRARTRTSSARSASRHRPRRAGAAVSARALT